ncbi:m02 protein [Murid betaherpesvirus 1]|nr:m02 protein [Murid betaherpesvirus 1]
MRPRSRSCASRPRGVWRVRVLLLVCAAVIPVVSSAPLPGYYCYAKNATERRKPNIDRDYWRPGVSVFGCRMPKGVCIEGEWTIEWYIPSLQASVINQVIFRSKTWLGPSMQYIIPSFERGKEVGCSQGFCVDRAEGNLIITDDDKRKEEWARKPTRNVVCKLTACLRATSVSPSSRTTYEDCNGTLEDYLSLPDFENIYDISKVVPYVPPSKAPDVPPKVPGNTDEAPTDESCIGCNNPGLNAAAIAAPVVTVIVLVSGVGYLCRSAESRQRTLELYRDLWSGLRRRLHRGNYAQGG